MNTMDCVQSWQKCPKDYIDALEEERRKIQVFRRELPLCLHLITQAIDACRQQLGGESECSVQKTIGEDPAAAAAVGEQQQQFNFIPIPHACSDSSVEEGAEKQDHCSESTHHKSDWLRSVQLWNHPPTTSSPSSISGDCSKKGSALTEGKSFGAFKPFRRDKDEHIHAASLAVTKPLPTPATASSTETARSSSSMGTLAEKDGHSSSLQRKARRCWSPELHRRFLHTLQQLGGPHVATPKQIRELMKVDGLTNDEVKSHLQKYRLHNRRPSVLNQSSSGSAQPPQLVVVGGIPSDIAAAPAATTSSEEEPASVTTQGPEVTPPHATESNAERRSHNRGTCAQSSSTATSSSTHTTTASPVF